MASDPPVNGDLVTTTQSPTSAREAPAAERPRPELAGLFALALLAVVWSWWGWQAGAWFGVVLVPGGIVMCAGLVVLAWAAPWRGMLRFSWSTGLALAALLGLAGWAALSALWSPAPDVAIADGQRIAIYALAFGLGLWMCTLLGSRFQLAAAPLAIAGAVVGGVTVYTLLTGDAVEQYLQRDGTLQFPLGYRNANAAFFLIAALPALGLAADRALAWPLRGAAVAIAALCIGLAMLSQSRGSVPAAAVALLVYVIASPFRLRAIVWLALAAVPAVAMLPATVDLYGTAQDLDLRFTIDELRGPARAALIDELRATGRTALIVTAVAAALGTTAALVERRLPEPRRLRFSRPWLVRAVAGVVVTGAIAVAAVALKPGDFISDRFDELTTGGSPGFSERPTRFQVDVRSNRRDMWRVAFADFRDNPVRGLGGGGWHYSYVRQREVRRTARDAHNVGLELMSELGAPGLALLLLALGGATSGALWARRGGPAAAALTAIALASGAYWLVHASVDWFWAYPALTAPVLALLGSACAPALLTRARRRRGGRPLLAVAAAALAVSLVPPFLAERYVNEAYAGWRQDLSRAYDDLDRARTFNRLSDAPLLAEGAIADAAGDRRRAIGAFRAAAEKRPEEWATHFLLAELFARDRPALARRELRLARELNPISREIDELAERLAEGRRN